MPNEQLAWVAALGGPARLEFLINVLWEVTLSGRGTYEPGTRRVSNPERLRALNELAHRVASQTRELVAGAPRYPDDVFAGIVLEHCQNAGLDAGGLRRRALEPLA
ncbi:hypothetical protein ACO2Q3_18260 [Caulobacter sp. KR2-114]|uniref:hypothetical protein n=1 Tax=Caulobacter sp. KR2-114 TaxID=3400912 RepID=UPI003C0A1B1D